MSLCPNGSGKSKFIAMNFINWRSLKTRVTLFTLAIFIISIWSLSFYASRMLHEDMQSQMSEQQFSTVSFMAADVNSELKDRMTALELIAGEIDTRLLERPADLQKHVEQRPLLQLLFNAGVFVTRLAGTAIAELPALDRVGVNYMDRDNVAAALKEGKSTIGKPVVGRKLRNANFAITVPIRDTQGKVIGAFSGVTDLSKPNFLDRVTASSYGETGGYRIVARQYRLIVAASEKKLIMVPLPDVGADPLIDQFVNGYEGSGILVNPLGEERLASSKGVPAAGWYVSVSLPTTEAFAPIHEMQQRMLLATIFLTLLAGGLTWWMLMRELAPVLATIKTLAARSDTGQPLQSLPVAKHDEIGELIDGFNRLLETLGKQNEALQESETRFSLFMDTLPAAAFIKDQDGINVYFNRYFLSTIGTPMLLGKSSGDLFPPDVAEKMVADDRRSLEEEDLVTEEQVPMKDGRLRIFQTHRFRIPRDGKPPLLGGISLDITELRLNQQRMEALLAEQKAVLDNDLIGIVRLRNRLIVWANPAYEKMLGYAPGELASTPTRQTYPSEEAYVATGAAAYPILAAGGIYRTQLEQVRKDGKHIWVDISGSILNRESGESLWGFIDITERKQHEAALEDLNRDFVSFLENTSDFIFFKDRNSRFRFCSQTLANITGHASWRDMIGKHDLEVFPEETAQIYYEEELPIFREGKPLLNKVDPYFDASGRPGWVNTNKWPQLNQDAKVVGLFGISRDITAQKQMEDQLRDSESRLRESILSSPNPIMMHAEDGEVLMISDAWTRITGYSLKDIPTTKSWADKAYGGRSAAVHEYIESLYEMQGIRQEGIHEVRTSSGEIRLWDFQSQSLPKLPDGRRVVLSLAADITSQKEAETALIAARKAADAANLAKSQFLANMSHEIRTPLNGLMGHVQLLEMTNLDSKQMKYVSTAMLCGNNLLSLINDILDLSKIEAEKVVLEQCEFSLRRCINYLILMQRSQIESGNPALQLEIPKDIPDALVGDELRVKQVLLNLLSNAIKFTREGSITVSVAAKEQRGNEVLIELAVKDTGIGMANAVVENIFKPFVQADSSITRKFGGTGLGLTIARRLTELMGGSINVESIEGVGSTFRVVLPFRILDHVALEHGVANAAPQDLWAGPVLKVLLAEDNELNQQFGVALMKKIGHQVNVVENGKDALAALEKERYDIVLMDIQMPVMDGSEALAALRMREQLTDAHLPVIALTAYAIKGDQEKFSAAGFDGYVCKPLEVKKLIVEMKRVMGLS